MGQQKGGAWRRLLLRDFISNIILSSIVRRRRNRRIKE